MKLYAYWVEKGKKNTEELENVLEETGFAEHMVKPVPSIWKWFIYSS